MTLTCTGCATQIPAKDGGKMLSEKRFLAHCKKCGKQQSHLVGLPARKPVELEFASRSGQP